MKTPSEELGDLDRVVHEPARLVILTALSFARVDFLYLLNLTGLTAGNLSAHLNRLEAEQYLTQRKEFVGKRTHTWVEITPAGREAVNRHWQRLDTLRKGIQQAQSDTEDAEEVSPDA
jgi:DNA-binding MarR family transcriptional regulator